MTSGSMVHQDDGGTVTLFGRDTQMLFVCDKGHWWIVKADSVGSNENGDAEPAEAAIDALREAFGDEPLRVMNLEG
jgi:hypothetical protein